MNSLQRQIVDRIRTAGPLPFAAYMQLALYDSRSGYYSSGRRRTGWRGHFITSPELDPSFGQLWAGGFRRLWEACGSPESFEVVEIGPGEGGFAEAVLDASEDDFLAALTYRMVERTSAVRDRQKQRLAGRAGIEWTDSITELPEITDGCVFANEVLDNLPVHLVECRNGEINELCVGEQDSALVFVARPPSNPELVNFVDRIGTTLDEGERLEVTLAGESLVARVSQKLHSGAVVFVDYGVTVRHAHRDGTLIAYSSAGVDTDVLADPGEKDITAHANWTSTSRALTDAGLEAVGPKDQREVLIALGTRTLETSFKEDYETAIAEGRGADAVAALSRRQALAALLDPGGLGGLQVMAGAKGIETPPFLK